VSLIWVCGVDEAGRGPLAGAVVAGAVVLDPENPITGLKDSKKLSAARREFLFEQIQIDEINILQATMLAMRRAIEDLSTRLGAWPDKALIDGNRCPELPILAEAIVKGDTKEPAISAASILAKVTRDRQMMALHELLPQYGFAQHMGYPTEVHFAALKEFGACDQHRRSFSPVRNVLALHSR
jgi:ribonuclease HII